MDPLDRAPRDVAPGLPRPRGDGPACASSSVRALRAPPPTRGWTPHLSPPPRYRGGSPAHAGMDPKLNSSARRARRLPRPRGDGPPSRASSVASTEAPPPTRGWTRDVELRPEPPRGSPAHAGMDPDRRGSRRIRHWLPRPRGDGPSVLFLTRGAYVAPPPTRGWTPAFARRRSQSAGSPAHAGMDPDGPPAGRCHPRLPRPRGDGPSSRDPTRFSVTAPPPTRGWTRPGGRSARRGSGSPAHAGMDPPSRGSAPSARRLPRPRGDGPGWSTGRTMPSQAPPPTRGWTRMVHRQDDAVPGSPAHAGMDPLSSCTPARRRGLPRPRGDGPRPPARPGCRVPAPPPTRGWTSE